ncbi:MAG: CDP-diacylglycerol--glycerol-3-phosphate 3-phosphatidyltransferase [Ruminococcaceae bacterium]|nr:CDP-diacylglycerol--glycerol-3-phosphate 3-phosphatidyltransferase [Oscillospiraceae bacterium]
MNLPNRLSILRILLIPPIILFLLPLPEQQRFAAWNLFISQSGHLVAFFIFAVASITDLIDGKIARSRNLVTTLGKFLDPIADKMLVVSVLIALVQLGRVHAIVTILIIIREFVITGIRLIAVEQGTVIAADGLGKAKTVTQIIAVLLILAESLLIRLLEPFVAAGWIIGFNNLILWVSVFLTILSGLHYLYNSRSLLKG